jgi:hypothetical protein
VARRSNDCTESGAKIEIGRQEPHHARDCHAACPSLAIGVDGERDRVGPPSGDRGVPCGVHEAKTAIGHRGPERGDGDRSSAAPLHRQTLRRASCRGGFNLEKGARRARGPGDSVQAFRSIVKIPLIVDVPVQFFQSVIAIELAVTGALLWQIRFFDSRDARQHAKEHLPDSRLRLGLALVLGATMFGSLWAIADEGPKWAALAVTVGLAVSLIPILLRVLPPLAKDAATDERDPDYAVTVLGLVLYVAVVAGFLVLLDID